MDISLIETFDDSKALEQIEKIEQALKGMAADGEAAGEAISSGFDQAEASATGLNTALDENGKKLSNQAKAVEGSQKNLINWRQELNRGINGVRVFGKSVGEWREQFAGARSAMDAAAASTGKTTVAARIFNTVLKASPIFLLIGIIVSLVAYFAKFQTAIDMVSRVWSGLNAVIDVAVERVAKFGSGIVKIISGNWREGFAEMRGAVSGVGAEMAAAAVSAYNLERRVQALRDAQIESSVQFAKQAAQLERIRDVVDDETKGYGRRIEALRQAYSVEKSITDERLRQAKENLDIITEQNKIGVDNVAKREKAAEAEIKFIEAQAEAEKTRRDFEKELRGLRKDASDERRKQLEDERKEMERIRKEYDKLIATVQGRTAALDLENTFNPVDKVLKQWSAALDEIEKFREDLYRLAPTEEDRAFVDTQIEKLFQQVQLKYTEELKKAQFEIDEHKKLGQAFNPLPPPDTIAEDIAYRARTGMLLALDAINQETKPILEQILTEIAETFNLRGADVISVDEARKIFGGITKAFEEAYQGYQALSDIQIEQQEQVVEALNDRVSAQEAAVNKQKELAEQGLANDLAIEKDKLAKLEAERTAAQQRSLELQRKAANIQLAIDSIQQVSALSKAAANVIAAESNKGLLGIVFALGAIGLIFKIFAQAKANAQKFSAVPKLRKGRRITGRTHEEGGEEFFGIDGNRYEAEDKEWLIGTGPSKEHDRFLERLNKNEYRGLDLNRIVGNHLSESEVSRAVPRIGALESQRVKLEMAAQYTTMARAYREGTDRVVDAIKKRKTIKPWKGGYIEEKENGTGGVDRKTVTPD